MFRNDLGKKTNLHTASTKITPTQTAPATLKYQLYSRIFSGHRGNKQIKITARTKNKNNFIKNFITKIINTLSWVTEAAY